MANGYSRTDLGTFGVSSSHRGRRLEEGIELIRQLWAGGAVSAAGENFKLEGFELFPLPLQRPGPPIFIGGHAAVAVRRAAALGDNDFISTTAGFPMVRELVAAYRGFLDELGKAFAPVLLNRVVCVVENAGQKADAEAFYAKALLALYDSWGHTSITGLSDRERSVAHIARANFIIGEAGECYERVLEYEGIGVGHIACLMNFGSPLT